MGESQRVLRRVPHSSHVVSAKTNGALCHIKRKQRGPRRAAFPAHLPVSCFSCNANKWHCSWTALPCSSDFAASSATVRLQIGQRMGRTPGSVRVVGRLMETLSPKAARSVHCANLASAYIGYIRQGRTIRFFLSIRTFPKVHWAKAPPLN